ncbi:hypothetical protein G4Y79_09215 [Phototrophicus methaneseepsis]|uniref:PRTRC system ThiF family protein n=1 Tax=Phototrophicus methaneseepsis TaxID=2710758 RepID=A0A7S8ECP5_9CHLR|nr:hypothetical protein [Phototrophicus methaneseepsis]QPC84535.1 hypothetical protein G4Y79_09215 [Phototrophicus methaneseepsis]
MQVFDPHYYIKTIAIIGLGGTQAQVARIVGQIFYDMQRNRRHAPQIVLIDPDHVEEKSVGRQLFSPSVLGMPKAEVVGRMFNMALGLDVRWIVDGVDPVKHFDRYGGNLEAGFATQVVLNARLTRFYEREDWQHRLKVGEAVDPLLLERGICWIYLPCRLPH